MMPEIGRLVPTRPPAKRSVVKTMTPSITASRIPETHSGVRSASICCRTCRARHSRQTTATQAARPSSRVGLL